MLFNTTLLEPTEKSFDPINFRSCLNARGLYNPRLFVLRLNPHIHSLVDNLLAKSSIYANEIDEESLQAYSTYIHETVHWWQHKGSISGFVRSMIHPALTHANLESIVKLTKYVGPQKPIVGWAENVQLNNLPRHPEADAVANSIINNFMDAEFFLALTYKPELATEIYKNNYFECAGHSFNIAYNLVISTLESCINNADNVFTSTSEWEEQFTDLKDREVIGNYYGSPIILAPVGLLHIYEGQARFIQLQFLSGSLGGLSLDDVKKAKFLENEYGKAFEIFLKLTESNEPQYIEDPLIALFLLICDISINPTAGFPLKIDNFENFFLDADPGIRFSVLCKTVSTDCPELRTYIRNYSKDEYLTATDLLTRSCNLKNPVEALELVASWEENHTEIESLLKEHKTFEFEPLNPVIRLLLSEFIEFSKDKLQRPEFFCWAGAWMTGGRGGKEEMNIWLKNLSLYSDKQDDGGIFPRQIEGRSKEAIASTFNNFYATNMIYDMTRQWILTPGPFKLGYREITTSIPEENLIPAVKEIFIKQFGVSIDSFNII